jgi:2-iminobutanoate/2-iminopropanoate deaminase
VKREIAQPGKSVSTGVYSPGLLVDGWLYISGQGPLDPATGRICGDTIEEQTRLTLENIGGILRAASCGFDDVVKCACHLARIDEFERFDRTYREFFPGVRPARTTVQSVLPGGMKVEIDAIARAKRRRRRERPSRVGSRR